MPSSFKLTKEQLYKRLYSSSPNYGPVNMEHFTHKPGLMTVPEFLDKVDLNNKCPLCAATDRVVLKVDYTGNSFDCQAKGRAYSRPPRRHHAWEIVRRILSESVHKQKYLDPAWGEEAP